MPVLGVLTPPAAVRDALAGAATRLAARILLTAPYWWSGFTKAFAFDATVAEMQAVGLDWPAVAAAATIVVQLVGSALVIAGRGVWLGAGALAVFTLAASVVAHPFWAVPAPESARALMTFLEHLGLIGGCVLAAVLHDGARSRASPADRR